MTLLFNLMKIIMSSSNTHVIEWSSNYVMAGLYRIGSFFV
jgi:hypothetical protein